MFVSCYIIITYRAPEALAGGLEGGVHGILKVIIRHIIMMLCSKITYLNPLLKHVSLYGHGQTPGHAYDGALPTT